MDATQVVNDLQGVVGEAKDVGTSAQKLVDGLAQLFHDAVNQGEAAAKALVDQIKAKAGDLASAVTANTQQS